MGGRIYPPGTVPALIFFLDGTVNIIHKYNKKKRSHGPKTGAKRPSCRSPGASYKTVRIPFHKQIGCRHTDNRIHYLLQHL